MRKLLIPDDFFSVGEERSKDWHFAVQGKDWQLLRHHHPEKIPYIVQRGTIFARMSPDQKSQLIQELQKIDYQVREKLNFRTGGHYKAGHVVAYNANDYKASHQGNLD